MLRRGMVQFAAPCLPISYAVLTSLCYEVELMKCEAEANVGVLPLDFPCTSAVLMRPVKFLRRNAFNWSIQSGP